MTTITGARLTPSLTILHGTTPLTVRIVDPEGRFSWCQDAELGNHPLVVVATNPAATGTVDLKLSEVIPVSGEDGYATQTAGTIERTYQTAPDDGKLFVAAARAPRSGADARMPKRWTSKPRPRCPRIPRASRMAPMASASTMPAAMSGPRTLVGTVVVYSAEDLSVVKTLDEKIIGHPRDVVIDEAGRAHVNDALTGKIHVFDAESSRSSIRSISAPATGARHLPRCRCCWMPGAASLFGQPRIRGSAGSI